jgi:hypothetical protein
VHPAPEPVLDPLRVRLRPARRRSGVRTLHDIGALPQHQTVLDAHRELFRRDELQVDMHQGRAVENDQQPPLTDMLAGEAGQHRPDPLRELPRRGKHALVRLRRTHQHEIEVRVLVTRSGGDRSTGDHRQHPLVRLGCLHHPLRELPKMFRHSFADHSHSSS